MTEAADQARRIAAESPDDPTAWFEQLYARAAAGVATVPWDRGGPSPVVQRWARGVDGTGRCALVVGAGLGADAELVAGLGFATTAFDVSETAVHTARARFPSSTVDYRVADLLAPPARWLGAFDLVLESLTVQSMPRRVRAEATAHVADFVAPGGLLVVSATVADPARENDGPPWPLTRAEVDAFAAGHLTAVRIDRLDDLDYPRWLAEFRRPAS
ncbi:class I SAM-dependent methyltransferase [Actinokineospora sp.]|uniref:class I SAM-dependent methyltransferase n=1 Tax=Actinokineospora sp. TaxID=1872133 RepID=UPI00403810AC